MNNYKLKKLIQINHGRSYSHLQEGKIPVYGSGGIMCHVNDYLYNGEVILLPRKGTLNNIMYHSGKLWTVDTMYYATVKEEAHPYFLYYYLKLLNLGHLDSGSALPSMTQSVYYDINVTIPNLDTQKKIASVILSLDKKIELNNRINTELESMAKTLYDYWFVQFDFPDTNGKPYKSSGGKMVYNKDFKREIPEGWKIKSFGDYSMSKGGFAFKSSWWREEGIPVVKIKDIQENNALDLNALSFVDFDKLEFAKNFVTEPGNIVIAMTGATIGKFALIPYTDKIMLVNQRVGIFKIEHSKLPFLICSLGQPYFRESIFSVSHGAAQPNISNEQINNIPLLYPKDEYINLFNKTLQSSYIKILKNKQENQHLSTLRDWLLPMLMNGQIGFKENSST